MERPSRRVEWMETRDGELFFLVAERAAEGWSFWERSTWEVRYYGVPPCAWLQCMAEALSSSHAAANPPPARPDRAYF